VSSNPVHGEVYSIQHYVIKFVSDLQVATGRWFSLGTPVSSTNKTDRHDITEIVLKVALNTINITKPINRSISDIYVFIQRVLQPTCYIFLKTWLIPLHPMGDIGQPQFLSTSSCFGLSSLPLPMLYLCPAALRLHLCAMSSLVYLSFFFLGVPF